MKHLKRYNESYNYKDLIEHIKMCFIEFSDDLKYGIEFIEDDSDKGDWFEIILYTGGTNLEIDDENIDYFLKLSKELSEFYLDLEVCIKRILDVDPTISYLISRKFLDAIYDTNGKEYISIDFFYQKNY